MKKGIASVLTVWILVNASLFSLFVINPDIKVQVSAATIIVDDDGTPGVDCNYTVIQWAIDNASDGDTVFVKNGTYYENVIVNKTINLMGEDKDKTIINGSNIGDVVLVVENYVNVSGFKIMECGGNPDDAGIDVESRFNTFSDNIIVNNRYGIYLFETQDNMIMDNLIFNNGFGVYLYGSSNNSIMGNNISNCSDGLKLIQYSDRNILNENNISNNQWNGILVSLSSKNYLHYNYVSFNMRGIDIIFNSDNNNISNNTVSFNNEDGIFLSKSSNNTVVNNTVRFNNYCGICLRTSAKDNILFHNNVSYNNWTGIYNYESSNTNIINNKIFSNNKYGIYIYSSANIRIVNNDLLNNNGFGLSLVSSANLNITANYFENDGATIFGTHISHYNSHQIPLNNIVNGKPIYYYKNFNNLNLINLSVGQVIMANCSNFKIHLLNINRTDIGVQLAYSSNGVISNNNLSNNIHGVYMYESTENNISNNVISSNIARGLYLYFSRNNNITNNSIFNNDNGTYFYFAYNNNFSNNNLSGNNNGVFFKRSIPGNVLIYNNISANNIGIKVSDRSKENIVVGNDIVLNKIFGIYIDISCEDNVIYHNNIIQNSNQSFDETIDGNKWNYNYPIGGNYWSDYLGVDNYKGPKQDQPGSDGIGDTNYSIDTDSVDHYPLMKPFIQTSFENYTILIQGWNLISLPLIQNEQTVTKVLEMIDGYYDAVQWYDNTDPAKPWKHNKLGKPFGNDLSHLNETMSFWIHITKPGDTIFLYNGIAPSSNQTIPLHPGWNMVGYPSSTKYNRSEGLNNLEFNTDVDCIQWYDAATQTWHFMGPDDHFSPGRGYWVHATAASIWEVPL